MANGNNENQSKAHCDPNQIEQSHRREYNK